MNNKQILDNAPEGATHYDGEFYLKCNEAAIKSSSIWSVMSAWGWDLCGALELNDVIDFRSLADIKRIAELEQENWDLQKRVDNFLCGKQLDNIIKAKQLKEQDDE